MTSENGLGWWASRHLDESPMLRYNDNKPRLTLVPASFTKILITNVQHADISWTMIEEVTRVLEFGADKYDDHNWRKHGSWTSVADSALRHLLRADPLSLDEESGFSHRAHFGCNLAFLIEYTLMEETGQDDRWKAKHAHPIEFDPLLMTEWENVLLHFLEWTEGGPATLLEDCLYYLNRWYHAGQ